MKNTPSPRAELSDIGIVAFVPDTWGEGAWQLRHQVLTRLGRIFQVIWVNPPIGWRASLGVSPARPEHFVPCPDDAPGLRVYRHSKWASKIYRPEIAARWTTRARVAAPLNFLHDRGCKVSIGYLWRPGFARDFWEGDFDFRCYHIDDEYTFLTDEQPIDDVESDIIARADQVYIHSPAMMDKKGGINPNTQYVPNGVDFELWSSASPMPAELRDIRTPIVMYIGVVQTTIDWPLLVNVVRALPELSFVFVGPDGFLDEVDRAAIREIKAQPNAHFLGGKPVASLPAYAQHADACIMPYKINDYTKYIFPLKVNEYLASGKPTIGSPINTLQSFSGVVNLAENVDDWCSALTSSVSEDPGEKEKVEARRNVARNYDWEDVVDRIARSMCELAGPDFLDRYEESRL